MKLLHVAASYLPATRYGGTIVSVHGLCRSLAARGHDVHVFTTSVDGPSDSDVPHGQPVSLDGVRVWYFQSTRWRRLFYAPDLRATLRARLPDFDIVHTHGIYLWPMWAAARVAAAADVPHVLSPRGMLEKALIDRKSAASKSVLIGFIEKRRLEHCAAVHVTSAREREQAEAFGFSLPPVYEVANGTELPDALARRPEPFVLFLGRINWKKGLDRLMAALPFAPSASAVLAGPDDEAYQRTLEEMAAANGTASRVRFAGSVTTTDRSSWLRRASALVLPSYSENFGNVVLEAWAEGCPVIVTPEVGLATVVAASGGGWVVDGSPRALGSAIEHAVTSAAAREERGLRGREEVCRRYSWPRIAEQMEHVYLDVLQRARTS
jgi:glycosyltransferase involved in cell wall biosynthesis